MHNEAWIAMLKRVPEDLYGKLMLVTTSGNEISIQNMYRMEEEYMIIRGRLAGTTELATVMVIPYDQVNYVGFREELKEGVLAILCGEAPPVVEAPPPPAPEPPPAPPPGKAALLERLRRTRAGQEPNKPG